MYREMRRKDREMDAQGVAHLLETGEYGVLASVDVDGLPHATPLSYVWHKDALWFHCALQGQKVDNVRHQPRVCFTIAAEAKAAYTDDFTTFYKSVMVYGDTAEVTDDGEKRDALYALCNKYLPENMDRFEDAMKALPATAVFKIVPVKITGKDKYKK